MKDTFVRIVGGHRIQFDKATSKRMGTVRTAGTAPELAVRRQLTGLGIHFRTVNRDLPGSPDIANRSARWAVFVHGCYWHRHSNCSRASTPRRNVEFWLSKFDANVARDRRSRTALRKRGYAVVTIWECQSRRPETVKRLLAPVIQLARIRSRPANAARRA